MKIRTGFVSNSSTSSYVVIGKRLKRNEIYKIFDIDPTSEDTWEQLEDKLGKDLVYYGEDGDNVFGFEIADISSDDYGTEESEVTVKDLLKAVKKVAKLLNCKDEEINILTGTRMS